MRNRCKEDKPSSLIPMTTWMILNLVVLLPSCMALNGSKNTKKQNLISFPLLHDQHIIARRRRLDLRNSNGDKNDQKAESAESAESTEALPFGTVYQGYGTHYVDLWVGTPPQRQTVIIDTGSDITAFPCQECGSKCGASYHIDGNFIHTNSSTFYKLKCDLMAGFDSQGASGDNADGEDEWIEFKEEDDDDYDTCVVGDCRGVRRLNDETPVCKVGVSYAEGSSWDAFEARDVVYLGGSHTIPFVSSDTAGEDDTADEGDEDDSKNDEEQNNERNRKMISNRHVRKRKLDTNEMNTTVQLQHNTIDLENEFKKEAEIVEEQYRAKHPHENNNELDLQKQQQMAATANEHSFTLSFGCQYRITGLFKTQLADGIMGMEYSEDSFWMQMYNANIIQSRMFALCFTFNHDRITKEGTLAGTMTLGGADPKLHDNRMVYAQNDNDDGWYTVYITGIYLKRGNGGDVSIGERKTEEVPMFSYYKDEDNDDGEETGDIVKVDVNIHKLNARGIIIDSGTTDSFLPSFVYKYFQSAYRKVYGMTLHDALETQNVDEVDVHSFPTILIQLKKSETVFDEDEKMYQGKDMKLDDDYGFVGSLDERHPKDVIIEIPPHHYLSTDKNKYRERFHINDDDGYGILGANSMFGYDILFDMENDRIGFAKSNCVH